MNSTNGKDLSSKIFWEQFYTRTQNKNFEWFLGFGDLKDYLDAALKKSFDNGENDVPRILEIGCGTSDISLKLFNHLQGRCYIDCVDYSEKAVKIMNSRLEALKKESKVFVDDTACKIAYHVADARFLPFNDGHFDLSIDKGTSDAILRSKNGDEEFIKTVTENLRVLRNSGTLLQFSDEGPESRMDLLQKVVENVWKVHPSCRLRAHYKDLGCFHGIDYFMYTISSMKT